MKNTETISYLPAEKGSYLLLMKLSEVQSLQIPHLKDYVFTEGYYIYIGSALGPGGIRARVGRHIRKEKKIHWHIDHLTTVADLYSTVLILSPSRLETLLTGFLMKTDLTPVPGFGCGDSEDYSHLFYSGKKKNFDLAVGSLTNYLQSTFPTQIWRFDV
ncbi:hypothetical protein BAC3_01637 [uncultured bacterium]|nr:hypothetical protein BAC3_01637 [uncultured bacterium]